MRSSNLLGIGGLLDWKKNIRPDFLTVLIVFIFTNGFYYNQDTAGFGATGQKVVKKVQYPYDVYLTPKVYSSCEEAWENGFHTSGIYALSLPFIFGRAQTWMWVFCNNTQNSTSTVFLYRSAGKEDFNRTWSEYVSGFGDPKTDYWIGLENIRNLTQSGHGQLRITIEDIYDTVRGIDYEHFDIGPRPSYKLNVSLGVGDLPDDLWYHNGESFHSMGNEDARDKNTWIKSCADLLKVGWWYRSKGVCAYTLLTGRIHRSRSMCRIRRPIAYCDGLYWSDWTGYQTLKSVTMELYKPKQFDNRIVTH